MRKILMFGTMLGMATTAFAFGGVFNHGSKSTTYKGGVSAIGVHFGGEKKTADSEQEGNADEHGCPVHSTYSEQYDQCFCEDGYYMFNQKCQPTHTTCAAQGGYWCANGEYSTCEESEEACYALCPEDRKCNGTCCGDGNVCHHEGDVYQCCNEEAGECCDASESSGYAWRYGPSNGSCCDSLISEAGIAEFNCGPKKIYNGLSSVHTSEKYYDLDCNESEEFFCRQFDAQGNCVCGECRDVNLQAACYGTDSNGHCRNTGICSANQIPYCGICCKSVDSEGIAICSGPGLSCCSGAVTYGEGSNLDTCEE